MYYIFSHPCCCKRIPVTLETDFEGNDITYIRPRKTKILIKLGRDDKINISRKRL